MYFTKKTKIILVLSVCLLFFTISWQVALGGWNHLVSGIKWRTTSVTFDFDDISWPSLGSDWKNRVYDAANKWNSASRLKFSYSGWSWNDWYYRYISDLNVLAQTRRYLSNGYLSEVNTDVNNRFSWYSGTGTPASYQYDLYSVVLHEFGHWYRLNDDYVHSTSVMFYAQNPGQVTRVLSYEEIEAARYMYP